MPAAGAALGAFIAAYGGYIAVAIAVLSTAYSYATRPNKPPEPKKPGDPGIRLNTRSTQEPIKVVYGVQKVGGNDVFMSLGAGGYNTLWIVQTLAEGECDSIYQDEGADQVWLGDQIESYYGSYATYTFHGGASDQTVDANLNAAFPEWTDTLRNTCYVVWKLIFDRTLFQSLPSRQILLKGKKLYDFRDATTAWSEIGRAHV